VVALCQKAFGCDHFFVQWIWGIPDSQSARLRSIIWRHIARALEFPSASRMYTMGVHSIPTLVQYIELRLGSTPNEQAINFLARPFGARTVSEFWQYWNPVWGYYLRYYCYRLLRPSLPRGMAVMLMFFICGLVHDLPFAAARVFIVGKPPLWTITVFFICVGLVTILTEKIGLDLARVPVRLRWLIHVSWITLCIWFALAITTRGG
jgi:hypothetical protein